MSSFSKAAQFKVQALTKGLNQPDIMEDSSRLVVLWAFNSTIFISSILESFDTVGSKHSQQFECLLKWFLLLCSPVVYSNILLYERIGFLMNICLRMIMSNDMCIYVYICVQMWMSVRRSTEDASKHVSTHLALITVSAAKASACTLMAGPALVSSKQKCLLHLL